MITGGKKGKEESFLQFQHKLDSYKQKPTRKIKPRIQPHNKSEQKMKNKIYNNNGDKKARKNYYHMHFQSH